MLAKKTHCLQGQLTANPFDIKTTINTNCHLR